MNSKVPVDLTFSWIPLPQKELVEKIFPNIQTNYKNHDWLREQGILAVKNKDCYKLNNIIQCNIQSKTITYKTIDIVWE